MVVADVSVHQLLTNPAAMEQLGVTARDAAGDVVFDFGVLQRLLQERYEQYVARAGQGGGGDEMVRRAVTSAFKYAQQCNAFSLLAGGWTGTVAGLLRHVNHVLLDIMRGHALFMQGRLLGVGA